MTTPRLREEIIEILDRCALRGGYDPSDVDFLLSPQEGRCCVACEAVPPDKWCERSDCKCHKPQEGRCCEEMNKKPTAGTTFFECSSCNCQCHKPVEGKGDGSVRCCDNGDMDEKHDCLKHQPKENWEKKFEEKFVPLVPGFSVMRDMHKPLPGVTANYVNLIEFIRNILTSQRSSLVQRVEGLRKELNYPKDMNLKQSLFYSNDQGYNSAISHSLEHWKEIIKFLEK